MNRYLHLGISTFIWIYLIHSTITHSGFFGTFFNKMGIKIFPNALFNIPGAYILLMLFFIIYVVLFYLTIWKAQAHNKS